MSIAKYYEDIWNRYFESEIGATHSNHPAGLRGRPIPVQRRHVEEQPPCHQPCSVSAAELNRQQEEHRFRSMEATYSKQPRRHYPQVPHYGQTPLTLHLVIRLIHEGYCRAALVQQIVKETGYAPGGIVAYFRTNLQEFAAMLSLPPAQSTIKPNEDPTC